MEGFGSKTDNQQIEQVFGGRSALGNLYFRPLYIWILRRLFGLLSQGRKPIADIADLVIWDRREFNTYADHAANVTLDLQRDWERINQDAIREAMVNNVNYQLCIDGARRGNGKNAVGIIVFAYMNHAVRKILLRGGFNVGQLGSSSLVDAFALEQGLQIFDRLMR